MHQPCQTPHQLKLIPPPPSKYNSDAECGSGLKLKNENKKSFFFRIEVNTGQKKLLVIMVVGSNRMVDFHDVREIKKRKLKLVEDRPKIDL